MNVFTRAIRTRAEQIAEASLANLDECPTADEFREMIYEKCVAEAEAVATALAEEVVRVFNELLARRAKP